MTKLARIGLLFCLASSLPLVAQGPTFDKSGNGLLSGTYYFRHVLYAININPDSSGIYGDISEAAAVYGNITFDGNGHYSLTNTTASDSQSGQSQLSGATGTYSISASGFGFIENAVTGDSIFGTVSANGVFAGSSTEATTAYSDLFIAAPLPNPLPTNSFFNGSYSAVGFLPGPSPLSSKDASFQLTPNGAGSLGTVNITGYYGGGGTTPISQSTANVPYFFSGGAAVVTFPSSTTADFYTGQEYLYFSPDGTFFFGGSPTNGYDMIVGVCNTCNPSHAQGFQGLYYNAGLYQDDSQLGAMGVGDFDSYYGSFNAKPGLVEPFSGNSAVYAHQRDDSIFHGVFGSTFVDNFPAGVTGSYTDTHTIAFEQANYALGAGGAIRIGAGIWPYIGIDVGLAAPNLTSGPSVYLSPQGIVNAASFSPFTAGVSNGEYLALFGSNLAPSAASAPSLPLPTTQGLNGVQVLVNGVAAPINVVSPTQLNIIMPLDNTFNFAQFQVINNGVASNIVTEPVVTTTPGIFTGDYGLGYAIVEHGLTNLLVTEASPAQPGETVVVYTGGLGTVFPAITAGTAAPTINYSSTVNAITAHIGGTSATVGFAGPVPTLAGLYQINVLIPSTVAAGDNLLDIGGPDSLNAQALIPIGSGVGISARRPAALAQSRMRAAAVPSATPRPAPCFFGAQTGCGKAQ